MATIYIEGKPVEVPDESSINRPPPSREYEPMKADFFNVEKMVEDSKVSWIESQVQEKMKAGLDEQQARAEVGDLPPGVEDQLRENIVDMLNETIEVEVEKADLYREYNKANCQKLIDKYENLLLGQVVTCNEIARRMKEFSHLIEETDEAVLKAHAEQVAELDALYSEWVTEDLKRQKYQIFVDDFQQMKSIAPE